MLRVKSGSSLFISVGLTTSDEGYVVSCFNKLFISIFVLTLRPSCVARKKCRLSFRAASFYSSYYTYIACLWGRAIEE